MSISVESLRHEIESYAHAACAKAKLPRSYIDDVIQDGWVEALIAEKQYDPKRSSIPLLHFIRFRANKACIKASIKYSREVNRGEVCEETTGEES